MLEWAIPVGLLLLGGVGFLVRRWLQGAGRTEAVERATRLLELKTKMEAGGVTPQDLNEFEKQLFSKPRRLRAIEDAVTLAINVQTPISPHDEVAGELADFFPTQAEMNSTAYSALTGAQDVLAGVVAKVTAPLSLEDRQRFAQSQIAWGTYANDQAWLASSVVEGGSIHPMIYAAELERLTVLRIAELSDFMRAREEGPE